MQYIPKQHYTGFNSNNSEDQLPLAFITPYSDDLAGKKRMETVNDWASYAAHPQASKIIDNNPATGFKIINEVNRWNGSRTGNVVWRIIDPRGFQLEISSGNLAYLINNITIEKGEFKAELVWGRDGAQNCLLLVGSPDYITFKQNSNAAASALSIKDIDVGDHIETATGINGIYLGVYYGLKGTIYDGEKFIRTSRIYIVKDANTGDLISKSQISRINIVKKGKEENKDRSDEINATGIDDYAYVFKKKPKVDAIRNAIHIEKRSSKPKSSLYYVLWQGNNYIAHTMYDDSVYLQPYFIDLKTNTVEVGDWNKIKCSTGMKIEPIAYILTVNEKEIILIE